MVAELPQSPYLRGNISEVRRGMGSWLQWVSGESRCTPNSTVQEPQTRAVWEEQSQSGQPSGAQSLCETRWAPTFPEDGQQLLG